MKTSSAKAKGRTLQNIIVSHLRDHFGLSEDDIRPAIMGESGVDIKMSSKSKARIPFDIECKNQESLNIWSAFSQAVDNSSPERKPLLVFKRNRSEILCCLRFADLISLLPKETTVERKIGTFFEGFSAPRNQYAPKRDTNGYL
jgi:hypothetical protein